MNLINKLTIKTILIITVIFTLFSSVLIIALTINYSSEVKRLNRIFVSTTTLKNYLYRAERSIYRFKEFKDEKQADIFRKDIYKLQKKIDELGRKFKERGFDRSQLSEFQHLVSHLLKTFIEYSNEEKLFGFNSNMGILQNLNFAREHLRSSILEAKAYSFLKDILILEIDEREFVNRRDIYFMKKFQLNYDNFYLRIQKSNLSQKKRDEITLNLREYQQYFGQSVEVLTKIGNYKNNGILGDIQNYLYNSYQIVDKTISYIDRKVKQERKQIEKFSAISIVTTLLLLLLTLFLFSKRVIKSFNKLHEFTVEFKNSPEVQFQNRDEFYEIGKNVEILVNRFKNEIISDKEISEEERDILENFERLSFELNQISKRLNKRSRDGISAIHSFSFNFEALLTISKSLESYLSTSKSEFEDGMQNLLFISEKIEESGNVNFSLSKKVDEVNKVLNGKFISSLKIISDSVDSLGHENIIIANMLNGEIDNISKDRKKIVENMKNINVEIVSASNTISAIKNSYNAISSDILKFLETFDKTFQIITSLKAQEEIVNNRKTKIVEIIDDIATTSHKNSDALQENFTHIESIKELNNRILKDKLQDKWNEHT